MEAWDANYFDMEVPAYLTIRKDLTGEFQFGLVQAQLDGKAESEETIEAFHRGKGSAISTAVSWSHRYL